jgi:hypothetical protein
MFNRKPVKKTALEEEIDRLIGDMSAYNADTSEYAKMADQLQKLYPLKETDTKSTALTRVSPDVWATIAANLTGIVLIVGHERAHVITTKALSFIRQLR